jgi:hypothetical protein
MACSSHALHAESTKGASITGHWACASASGSEAYNIHLFAWVNVSYGMVAYLPPVVVFCHLQ